MKKLVGIFMIGLFSLSVAISTAASSTTSFLGDTSKFKKSKDFPDSLIYRNPNKKNTDYDKFFVEPVIFVQSKNSKYKKLTKTEQNQLSELFQSIVVNAIKKDYAVVSQTGPGVLRIRFAIRGLRRGSYYLNNSGTQQIDAKTKLAAATFELETSDSVTGERISALSHQINEANLDKKSREEALVSVSQAFTDWVAQLKAVFDSNKSPDIPSK